LNPEFAARLRVLRPAAQAEPLGLYVHIPFCLDRCTYCSFTTTRDRGLQPDMVRRLLQEVGQWGAALGRPAVDTLYLGGGTPSLLSPTELADLTAAVHAAFDLVPLAEATLEANPGTVDLAWLRQARELGWDRISLGIQALDDELLARLGRIHGADQALESLALAERAGFRRRSADLMVGIPGQSLSKVLDDARTLVATGLEHLSIYLLDLDKACPLRAEVDAGRLALPTEDEVADVFEALQAELPRLGLAPYEISNYARPGAESIHNTRYWERRPYLGLGPGAASQLGPFRWTESANIAAWTRDGGVVDLQELDAAEALAEIPLLGLRQHAGVDWPRLRDLATRQNLLPLVDAWEQALRQHQERGLLARDGPILRLTDRGRLLSNQVFEVFV